MNLTKMAAWYHIKKLPYILLIASKHITWLTSEYNDKSTWCIQVIIILPSKNTQFKGLLIRSRLDIHIKTRKTVKCLIILNYCVTFFPGILWRWRWQPFSYSCCHVLRIVWNKLHGSTCSVSICDCQTSSKGCCSDHHTTNINCHSRPVTNLRRRTICSSVICRGRSDRWQFCCKSSNKHCR